MAPPPCRKPSTSPARLRLDGLAIDSDPEGPPSALRTALVAWSAVIPGASHHLVVQNDVDAAVELLEIVARAAARFPEEALVFYTNWHARNGAAARLAALAGAAWVRGVPDEFTPSLGVSSVRDGRRLPGGRPRECRTP
jgi:hypothetical protein